MNTTLLWEAGRVRLRHCRGGAILYNKNDQYIGRALDIYGELSREEASLLAQIVRPGMWVIDVGANIGVHTIAFAQGVGSEGRVLAFEPQRIVYQTLCGNVALNALDNVWAHNLAVSKLAGAISVPTIDYASAGNFGGVELGGGVSGAAGEPVAVTTIDTFALPRCDFMKIDVEGMELDVFEGAIDTLRRFKPILYVENDRREKSAPVISFLFALGYRLFWHLPRAFHQSNHFQNQENVFGDIVSINVLCIPLVSSAPVTQGFVEITSKDDWWRN
jgi:FkbM family methyltransferase